MAEEVRAETGADAGASAGAEAPKKKVELLNSVREYSQLYNFVQMINQLSAKSGPFYERLEARYDNLDEELGKLRTGSAVINFIHRNADICGLAPITREQLIRIYRFERARADELGVRRLSTDQVDELKQKFDEHVYSRVDNNTRSLEDAELTYANAKSEHAKTRRGLAGTIAAESTKGAAALLAGVGGVGAIGAGAIAAAITLANPAATLGLLIFGVSQFAFILGPIRKKIVKLFMGDPEKNKKGIFQKIKEAFGKNREAKKTEKQAKLARNGCQRDLRTAESSRAISEYMSETSYPGRNLFDPSIGRSDISLEDEMEVERLIGRTRTSEVVRGAGVVASAAAPAAGRTEREDTAGPAAPAVSEKKESDTSVGDGASGEIKEEIESVIEEKEPELRGAAAGGTAKSEVVEEEEKELTHAESTSGESTKDELSAEYGSLRGKTKSSIKSVTEDETRRIQERWATMMESSYESTVGALGADATEAELAEATEKMVDKVHSSVQTWDADFTKENARHAVAAELEKRGKTLSKGEKDPKDKDPKDGEKKPSTKKSATKKKTTKEPAKKASWEERIQAAFEETMLTKAGTIYKKDLDVKKKLCAEKIIAIAEEMYPDAYFGMEEAMHHVEDLIAKHNKSETEVELENTDKEPVVERELVKEKEGRKLTPKPGGSGIVPPDGPDDPGDDKGPKEVKPTKKKTIAQIEASVADKILDSMLDPSIDTEEEIDELKDKAVTEIFIAMRKEVPGYTIQEASSRFDKWVESRKSQGKIKLNPGKERKGKLKDEVKVDETSHTVSVEKVRKGGYTKKKKEAQEFLLPALVEEKTREIIESSKGDFEKLNKAREKAVKEIIKEASDSGVYLVEDVVTEEINTRLNS